LSDNDLAFINTLNKILIAVGVFSVIFSLVLGSIMAKKLSQPIARVISSAQSIAGIFFRQNNGKIHYGGNMPVDFNNQ